MKVRPLGDRVIVRRIGEEERTKGGLIIPDTAKEKPMEGEVIAVGKGKVLEATLLDMTSEEFAERPSLARKVATGVA